MTEVAECDREIAEHLEEMQREAETDRMIADLMG